MPVRDPRPLTDPEAEPLHVRALAILEKALDPEHPHVATCLESYAFSLRDLGRPEEAEPLEARASREQFRERVPNI